MHFVAYYIPPGNVLTLYDSKPIFPSGSHDQAGGSATEIVGGAVAQGEHDELNIGYIPHLTIYILDLTLECAKSAEDSHGEDGVSAMETNSGGVTMSGKLIPHLLYFMDDDVLGHMPEYIVPIDAQKKELNHMISELSVTPKAQTAAILDGQTVDISARLTYRHYITGKNPYHSSRSCF